LDFLILDLAPIVILMLQLLSPWLFCDVEWHDGPCIRITILRRVLIFRFKFNSVAPVAHERLSLTIHFQDHIFDGLAMREVDLVPLQRQRPNSCSRRSDTGHI
jgi:hypothetical protein